MVVVTIALALVTFCTTGVVWTAGVTVVWVTPVVGAVVKVTMLGATPSVFTN